MAEEGLHRLEEEEGAVIVSSPVTKPFQGTAVRILNMSTPKRASQ